MSWDKLAYTPTHQIVGAIELPASKSIANRALILRAIAERSFEIENLSNANDTVLLKKILSTKKIPSQIDCQDAGTALRFLTCLCAATPDQQFTLTGTTTLLQRPMKELIDVLTLMGAQIKPIVKENKITTIQIEGQQLINKKLTIAGNISSQFISGLCLISPLIKNGLTLQIIKPIFSVPYIHLTLDLLSKLGIRSTFNNNLLEIKEQKIIPTPIKVAADWSSASFFYAFMILNPLLDSLLLKDLDQEDVQGDRYIAELCSYLGIKTTFNESGALLSREKISGPAPTEIDLANYPDLAVPLIVSCAFQHSNIRFTGLSHLRGKESDRIAALQSNLEHFGVVLYEKNGTLWFESKASMSFKKVVKIKTYEDHRIAMSFSLLAVLGTEIHLDNTKCIDKSFPRFLEQISKLGITIKN